jgi:hypothetical protein
VPLRWYPATRRAGSRTNRDHGAAPCRTVADLVRRLPESDPSSRCGCPVPDNHPAPKARILACTPSHPPVVRDLLGFPARTEVDVSRCDNHPNQNQPPSRRHVLPFEHPKTRPRGRDVLRQASARLTMAGKASADLLALDAATGTSPLPGLISQLCSLTQLWTRCGSRLGTARQQLSARSDQRSLRAHRHLNYVLGLLCFRQSGSNLRQDFIGIFDSLPG